MAERRLLCFGLGYSARAFARLLGAEWPVHRINLVASRTGAGGSTYTDVAVVDL